MVEFLQANLASILGMLALTAIIIFFQARSAMGDTDALDKKRIAKGMAAMSDDEKQLAAEAFRTSSRNTAVMIFAAYIVSTIINHFF